MCFGLHVDKVKHQVGIVINLSNCYTRGLRGPPGHTAGRGRGRGEPWSWGPLALCMDRDPALSADALLGRGWSGLRSNLVLWFLESGQRSPQIFMGPICWGEHLGT